MIDKPTVPRRIAVVKVGAWRMAAVLAVGVLVLTACEPPFLTALGSGPRSADASAPVEIDPPEPVALERDCGLSAPLSDGSALWVFCDTTVPPASAPVVENSAAIADPADLVEPLDVLDGGGDPSQFITATSAWDDRCDPGVADERRVRPLSVSSDSGGATDVVYVFFEHVCLSSGTRVGSGGIGVAEFVYDPASPPTGALAATVLADYLWDGPTPTTPPGGGAPDTELMAGFGRLSVLDPTSGKLHVYRCDTDLAVGCQVGRVDPASAATVGAYEWWNGSGFGAAVPDPGTATMNTATAPGSGVVANIAWHPEMNKFVLSQLDATAGSPVGSSVSVRVANNPTGAWSDKVTVTPAACAANKCRDTNVHPVLSGETSIAISYYSDPTAGGDGLVWKVDADMFADGWIDVGPGDPDLEDLDRVRFWGIVEPTHPDYTFRPDDDATRAEFAQMLHNAADKPGTPPASATYTDVGVGHPAFAAVEWLAATGRDDTPAGGAWDPDTAIDRQTVAEWLWRDARQPVHTASETFTDVPAVHPSYDAIMWTWETGYVGETTPTTWEPSGSMLRRQAAILALVVQDRTVTGRVTDEATTAGIDGATVRLYDDTDAEITSVTTDASGRYRIASAPIGTGYTLGFEHADYIDEWHDDKAQATTPQSAANEFGVALDPNTRLDVTVNAALVDASDDPYEPVAQEPTGLVASRTPTLSAIYEDRGADDGYVEFEIIDAATEQSLAVLAGSTVASGETSTVAVPAGTLGFESDYWVRTTSVDVAANRSTASVTTSLRPRSPDGPVYAGDFPDPAFTFYQGTYYAFGTNAAGPTGALNVPRLEASSLDDWSGAVPDEALDVNAMGGWAIPDIGNTWAPGLGRFGGEWVLYYGGIVQPGKPLAGTRCIGAATSATLDGDFADDREDPLVCELGGVIDPSVFRDSDGTPYLLWKTDNVPSGEVHLKIRQLDGTGRGWAGDEVTLLTSNSALGQDWEKISATEYQMEQPEMVRRGGKYWLFYSGNDWESKEYAVGYAVCDTPTAGCSRVSTDAVGPWFAGATSTHAPTTFETATAHGPGAASFATDQFGGTWMAYHGWVDENAIGYTNGGARGLYIDKANFALDAPTVDIAYPRAAGEMIDIDPADAIGGGNSAGWAINNAGEIAGIGLDPAGDSEAIWWHNGLLLDSLAPLASGPESAAAALNDSTAIVGSTFGDATAERGVRWVPDLVPVPLPGAVSYAAALAAGEGAVTRLLDTNNAWTQVGASTGAGTGFTPTRWTMLGKAERLIDSGPFAGALGQATAINEHGDAVGFACSGLCTETTGFFKPDDGPAVDLGGLGGTMVAPTDVNDDGLVVGSAEDAGGATHAFVWDGTMTNIGAQIPGSTESHAEAINDHGQVVGWYLDAAGKAQGFLWRDDVVIAPLGDLGGGETKAYAINDHGLITGTSRVDPGTGEWHAFLRGGPDPGESFGEGTVIVDGPGVVGLPSGASVTIGFPPGVGHAGYDICPVLVVDISSAGFFGPQIRVQYSDSSSTFYNKVFTPVDGIGVGDNQVVSVPGFSTDAHWPVSISVTQVVGTLDGWDVYPTTC